MRNGKPFPYEDILYHAHHTSPTRAKMSMIERAAQFAPFAALTGYDAAIKETARLTGGKAELDESEQAELDKKLRTLQEHSREFPPVRVTHFVRDLRKEGGAYILTEGSCRKVDSHLQLLVLTTGQCIPLSDILELESDLFGDD